MRSSLVDAVQALVSSTCDRPLTPGDRGSPEDVSWVLGELAQQALGHQEEKKAGEKEGVEEKL